MPVYDTLLVLSPEGELEPNMATEWSYNEDNTVLTLTLQDGITFTDGEPFNAEAVKANVEYLRDGGGPFSSYVASVENVVAGRRPDRRAPAQQGRSGPAVRPRRRRRRHGQPGGDRRRHAGHLANR